VDDFEAVHLTRKSL
jgi:hypothetical protein